MFSNCCCKSWMLIGRRLTAASSLLKYGFMDWSLTKEGMPGDPSLDHWQCLTLRHETVILLTGDCWHTTFQSWLQSHDSSHNREINLPITIEIRSVIVTPVILLANINNIIINWQHFTRILQHVVEMESILVESSGWELDMFHGCVKCIFMTSTIIVGCKDEWTVRWSRTRVWRYHNVSLHLPGSETRVKVKIGLWYSDKKAVVDEALFMRSKCK